ncbi:MAG: NAD(P)-dependent oxidoreductase [Patescibacteria group bacterium]
MKILYSHRTEEEKNHVAKALSSFEMVFHDGSLQKGEKWDGKGIEIVSVFVDSILGKEEFEKMPDLKFIATRSTGFDHIDLKIAKKKGVIVSNVPTYGEHTVAEFTFALLLNLSRNILAANSRVVKEGSFSPNGLTGFDLFEKTIGVLGTGKIGKNVIKIAKGFGMNVIAFDAFPDTNFAKEQNFKYVTIDELIQTSDIISLHLPENKDTHHIINKEKILKMKKGVVIINTARGSLIDTAALVFGLEEKIISAAGLDVLSEEKYINDETQLLSNPHPNQDDLKTLLMNHYLIDRPKVIITPHTAFNTKEANQRIINTSIENIIKFEKGNPQNIVL